MQRYVITDSTTIYTRITKRAARKLFDSEQTFHVIAHKMRPGMPFSLGMTIDGLHYAKKNAERAKYDLPPEDFDRVVREFCWYNANSYETGYYAAFYTLREKQG